MALHPAARLTPLEAATPGERVEGVRVSSVILPQPLRPSQTLQSRSPSRGALSAALAEARARRFEAGLRSTLEEQSARAARYDALALDPERLEEMREAEARIAKAERDVRTEAARAVRNLELRKIALETQARIMTGEPRERVMAEWRSATEEQRLIERNADITLARIRSDEFQAARMRLEESDLRRERQRSVEAATRAADAARAVRAYQEMLTHISEGAPEMEIPQAAAVRPEVDTPPASEDKGAAQARSRQRAREPKQPDREVMREATAQALRVIGRRLGYRLVSTPSPGIPDKTDELLQELRQYWGIR